MKFGNVAYLVTIHNNIKKAGWFWVWEKDMKPSISGYQSRIWLIYWVQSSTDQFSQLMIPWTSLHFKVFIPNHMEWLLHIFSLPKPKD